MAIKYAGRAQSLFHDTLPDQLNRFCDHPCCSAARRRRYRNGGGWRGAGIEDIRSLERAIIPDGQLIFLA